MSLSVKIKKSFGPFHLDVAFEAANEVFALLGASGCGKSVTLRCIAGIETPEEGRIVLDGRVLFDSERHINLTPQQRQVGYLFQQYALFPNMTVEQNIAAGIRGKRGEERRREVAHMVELFQLDGLGKKHPAQLSGGQQQRVALARILASRPQAILLDEPFSALDSFLKWQLENELSDRLHAFGGTTLWVSHDRDEIYRNCSHVCVIENGCASPVVTMKELFANPGTVSAARLSGCKNFVSLSPLCESRIRIPDWGCDLTVSRPPMTEETVLGIRAHHIRFAQKGEQNSVECRVVRITEDVFSLLLMLLPLGADVGTLPLRMETPKESWDTDSPRDTVWVTLPAEELLLLRP